MRRGRPTAELKVTDEERTVLERYGSWLNQVERWFGLLTQRQIKRGAHKSVAALKAAIEEFLAAHNGDPKPFVWTKSADEIIAKIGRFATRTLAVTDGQE